jgi:hypothetical protein
MALMMENRQAESLEQRARPGLSLRTPTRLCHPQLADVDDPGFDFALGECRLLSAGFFLLLLNTEY